MAERICYHSRLPCPADGKCAVCDLHKSILSDTTSKKELLKHSNAIRLPNPRPYSKYGPPSGAPGFGIEVGVKGTF